MNNSLNSPTPQTPKRRGSNARLAVIVGCLLLLFGALVVGHGTSSNSVRARTDRIASDIKCPTCQGLSVKQSSAGPAKAIYAEIQRQVIEGQTDANIRGYLVSRFGTEQLLRPEATGVTSIVWIAPVVFGVFAFAGLLLAFARWRPKTHEQLSAADEALVATFRSERHGDSD
jgi:cytochrome c-type biogenesis protein CcmH/NrfF